MLLSWFLVTSLCAGIASVEAGIAYLGMRSVAIEMGPITLDSVTCNLVELEGYGPSTGATMISAYEVGVDQSRFREVRKKCYKDRTL